MITDEQISSLCKSINPTSSPITELAKAIYRMAIEDAAAECERMRVYPGGRCESPVYNDVWDAATGIRKLGEVS
jgi:hypothetical protein